MKNKIEENASSPKLVGTDMQIKIQMFKASGIKVPAKMKTEEFFDKMIAAGFTRYSMVKYILPISTSKARRVHLEGGCEIEIDESYKVTITRTQLID